MQWLSFRIVRFHERRERYEKPLSHLCSHHCGCSDYLSLSKASTISNPQTEYDTALKEYLASLETPLSTIEIKHGEDTPIVWEDTGMEAAVRLLLNCPEGTISRSDVWTKGSSYR